MNHLRIKYNKLKPTIMAKYKAGDNMSKFAIEHDLIPDTLNRYIHRWKAGIPDKVDICGTMKKDILTDYKTEKNIRKIATKYKLNYSNVWRHIQEWVKGINYNQIYGKNYKRKQEGLEKTTISMFCRNCADFERCKSEGWAVCPYAGMTYFKPKKNIRIERLVEV